MWLAGILLTSSFTVFYLMSTMRWLHWVDFVVFFFYFICAFRSYSFEPHTHQTKPNPTETNQMNCSAPCTFANYSTNIGNCRFLAFSLFDEHSWIVCLLFFYWIFLSLFCSSISYLAICCSRCWCDVVFVFYFSSFHHSILLSNLIIIFSLFIFADKLIWDQLYGRALVQSLIC